MVDIYVRREDNGEWIRGFAIPPEDIQRFSLRPLKWLRFVAFAVLGAKGDLLDAPDGNIVNYDTLSVTDLAESYHFFPDGPYHLVDPKGLADKTTASTASTARRHDVRNDVAQRDDNCCVITGAEAEFCHAAHIISHSKDDQYIRLVISDRGSLYEFDLLSDLNIDSSENRMFLNTQLHTRFGKGASVFLKTPNFALDPADVPRVEPGETPTSRTTIQHLKPWKGVDPVLQRDVRVDWTVQDAPPSILLDYTYGVAVIQRWATTDIRNLLEEHHETRFNIANTPSSILRSDYDDDDAPADSGSEYVPSRTVRHGIHQTRTEAAQCRAIDTAIAFSMFIKGHPPGTTFDVLLQKQQQEAEMRSHQVARDKVQGWLEASEL